MVSQATLAITLSTLVFSLVSFYLNRKIGGREKVKAIQKEINDFQKSFEKANKEKDEKELARLKLIEPQVMGKMQEMLFLPLKAMIVILPLFLIFIYLIQQFYPGFTIVLPIGIHPQQLLSLNVLHDTTYGSRGFFIVCSIVFNLIFEMVWTKILKRA